MVGSPEGTLTARMEVVEQLEARRNAPRDGEGAGAREAVNRVDPEAVADGIVVPLLNGLEHMEVLARAVRRPRARWEHLHFQAYRAGRVQIIEATGTPVVTIASGTLPRRKRSRRRPSLASRRIDVRVAQSRRVTLAQARADRPARRGECRVGEVGRRAARGYRWRARLESAVAETCEVAARTVSGLRAAAQWKIIDEMAGETTPSRSDVAAGRRPARRDRRRGHAYSRALQACRAPADRASPPRPGSR